MLPYCGTGTLKYWINLKYEANVHPRMSEKQFGSAKSSRCAGSHWLLSKHKVQDFIHPQVEIKDAGSECRDFMLQADLCEHNHGLKVVLIEGCCADILLAHVHPEVSNTSAAEGCEDTHGDNLQEHTHTAAQIQSRPTG